MEFEWDPMKKTKSDNNDELRPEYDFRKLLTGGVRGKYYQAMQAGYTITIHKEDGTTVVKHIRPSKGTIVLEPDVQRYFPDSESVNNALCSLIQPVPSKRRAMNGKRKVANTKHRALATKGKKSLRS